jgi:hypothetical protein
MAESSPPQRTIIIDTEKEDARANPPEHPTPQESFRFSSDALL